MKREIKIQKEKLPCEEWDFFDLEEDEISLAFFYEYGRSSDKVVAEVKKMREARPFPRCGTYCPREHHIYGVLFWLAQQEPHFPKTPWLTLKANVVAEIQTERARIRHLEAQMNAQLPDGQKFCAGGISGNPGDPVRSIDWMVGVIRGGNIDLRFSCAGFSHSWLGDPQAYQANILKKAELYSKLSVGEFKADPASSRLEGQINWRASDEEIIDRFKFFLEMNRPPQFRKNAKIPMGQRGYDVMLPFGKGSALKWLGVLRKRRSVISWREYLKAYGEKEVCGTNAKTLKSKDVTALASKYLRDCRKAELILDSFNNGTALSKDDFK